MTEVVQAATFCAYLKAQQEHVLRSWIGSCRWVWNRCVEFDGTHRECTGKSIPYAELTKWLPIWKENHTWLAEVGGCSTAGRVRALREGREGETWCRPRECGCDVYERCCG